LVQFGHEVHLAVLLAKSQSLQMNVLALSERAQQMALTQLGEFR
jgi:hypothetical protein